MNLVEEEHIQSQEFNLESLISGPIRRLLTDAFSLTPMVIFGLISSYVTFISLSVAWDHYVLNQDTLLPSYVNVKNIPELIEIGLFVFPFVALMYDAVFFLVYMANISF